MQVYINNNPEQLGVLGISFLEKIAVQMRKELKGLPEEKSVNSETVKSLYRQYASLQASGFKPAIMQNGKMSKIHI